MPGGTNYNKWSKFANDLHSDTESEEEADLKTSLNSSTASDFLEKKSKYLHIPAKEYIPGGKVKLMGLLENCGSKATFDSNDSSESSDSKEFEFIPPRDRGFSIEMHPNEKEKIRQKLLNNEELTDKDKQLLEGERQNLGTSRILKKFNWKHIGSQFLPGYSPQSNPSERYLWRVWYDDCFLETQQPFENPAARRLIGSKACGSFVVGKLDRETGEDVLISKKEVVDLVYKRADGGDAEKIEQEIREGSKKQEMLKNMGMEMKKIG